MFTVELKYADLFQCAGKLGYSVDVLPDEKFFELIGVCQRQTLLNCRDSHV